MNSTAIVAGQKFQESVDRALKKVFELSRAPLTLLVENNVFLSTRDPLKRLSIPVDNSAESVIFEIIFLACKQAEKISPASAEIILAMLEESFGTSVVLESDFSSFKNCLSNVAKRPDMSVIRSFIHNYLTDTISAEITCKAADLAGLSGRLIIEECNRGDSIELTGGHNFFCKTHFQLCDVTKPWTNQNVKVCVIDGSPDSVGEVHNLLEAAASSKQPLAIIARGFSADVMSTIVSNTLSKKINVIPISVPIAIDSLNTPKDITVVCGGEMISSLKGDLISSVDFDKLPTVDSLFCNGSMMTIHNESTKEDVNIHVKNLIKQRDDALEDVRNLIDKRITSLSSVTVLIRISKNRKESVSSGMRAFKASLDRGVVDLKDVAFNASRFQIVRQLGIVPTSSLLVAIDHVESIVKMIDGTEAMIYSA